MYIKTNDTSCPCVGYAQREGLAVFRLGGEAPETLGETVELYQDNGFLLATQTVADYLRWELSGGTLLLTDTPAPGPGEEPGA